MNELLVVGVLLALVGLRLLMVGVLAILIIRPVSRCPACFESTVPVRVPVQFLLPRLLEWRWCPSCLWEGPARRVPADPGAREVRPDVRERTRIPR